jgi:cyclophilin family peptidyl-prolyl cis-trans isomerase
MELYMKALRRTIISAVLAVLLALSCFAFTGCSKDIRTAKFTISLYDYENSQTYAQSEVTIYVDLYRHLAPNTVDTMVKYIGEGYYDNTVFYKTQISGSDGFFSAMMLGDIKLNGEDVALNETKPMIPGECEAGGTIGSNLKHEKDMVSLWRTWDENGPGNNIAPDTGRATWFMPASSLKSYDGYFCVFGKLRTDIASTSKAITEIRNVFSEATRYEDYVVYYTGEYDETKANEDFGLTGHIVLDEDFNADLVDGLFTAEDTQYVGYNARKIRIPVTGDNGVVTAKIVKAEIV